MALLMVGKTHKYDSLPNSRVFITPIKMTPDNDDVKLYSNSADEIKTRLATISSPKVKLEMNDSLLPADLIIQVERFYNSWRGYVGPKPLDNPSDILWVLEKIGEGVMNGQVVEDTSPRNIPLWNRWKELSHPLLAELETLNMKSEAKLPEEIMQSLKEFYKEWGLSQSDIPSHPADAHEAVIEIGLQVQNGNLPNVEWETRLVNNGTMHTRELIMEQAQQLSNLLERFASNDDQVPSQHLTRQLEAFYKSNSWPLEDRPIAIKEQIYALRSIARQIQKSIKGEKDARAYRKAERSAVRQNKYSSVQAL